MPMNIAIDGPVGAGKSSIADQVAQRLHILHLDTGAMYRTVALYMLRNGIDPQDEQTVSAHCGEAEVRVAYRDGAQRTMLGGEDVSDRARRRYRQQLEKGDMTPNEQVLAELNARDAQDMNRKTDPLRQAEDAVLVDSTNMTPEQVVDAIIAVVEDVYGKRA